MTRLLPGFDEPGVQSSSSTVLQDLLRVGGGVDAGIDGASLVVPDLEIRSDGSFRKHGGLLGAL
jgi:hypothetical protein